MSSREGARPQALSSLDRTLTASDDVVVIGPLVLPPLPALRRAVGVLAQALPQARLGWSLEVASGRWLPHDVDADALGEQLVRAAPELDAAALGFGPFAQRAAAFRPADVPVMWIVAGDWLALSISHVVGDADLINALATGLVEAALTGRVSSAAPAPCAAGAAHPLRTALAHHYGRRPTRVVAAVRAVVRARADARAVRSLGAAPEAARGVPQAATAVHAVVSPSAAREMKVWQRAHAPAVSSLALATVLAHRALASVGIGPDPLALVLYDIRAYLPPGVRVSGNFVIGVRVLVGAPGALATADLATTDSAIRGAVVAGRPLTALVAVQLQQLARRVPVGRRSLRRPQAPSATVALVGVRPVLVVTTLGRRRDVEELPWREDAGDPVFSALGSPAAGEITFAATFVKGRRQYSLSFDPSAFDAGAVQRAVEVLAHEPLTLLAPPS